MTSSVRCRSRVALTLLVSSPLACLGPNPLLEAGEVESETEADGDGDGDPTTGDGDGESETNGDGDGDGDTAGDGDGDAGGCSNGMQDGDETDLDCGGSCAPCGDGLACLLGSDCASMICEDELCAAPSCNDGVMNGAEVGVDCGGECTFCEYGPLHTELDVFEGSSASFPHVEMLADLGFALTYVGEPGAKLAWFDEFGEPVGETVDTAPEVTTDAAAPLYFDVDLDADDGHVHIVDIGLGPMSGSRDAFLVRRTPEEVLTLDSPNEPDSQPVIGDISVNGNTALLVWNENNTPMMRRYDYAIGDGSWVDLSPQMIDGPGSLSSVTLDANSEGVAAITWVRCSPCQVLARRFDGVWIDPEPVVVHEADMDFFYYSQIAYADDGRAFVAWFVPGIDEDTTLQARMLDEDFVPVGETWTLQTQLAAAEPYGAAALSDGSFAIAWADRSEGRVHLSRYVGPDTLKNPNYPDEGPWDNLDMPREASIATLDNRLVVTWTATVDMIDQVQGQVLAF